MDVRNWGIDQILMLPDHCLSRRFVVSCTLESEGDETLFDISEMALPDKTIVHELIIYGSGGFGKSGIVRLALGDQLPANVGMMSALEPVFRGLGLQGSDPRPLTIIAGSAFRLTRLKMFLPAQGRKLVMEMVVGASMIIEITAAITVSTVPTEIPDCLLSI